MAVPPTDSQILLSIAESNDLASMARIVAQMEAGANPYGFASPGTAAVQLRLMIDRANLSLQPGNRVTIPTVKPTSGGTAGGIAGGIGSATPAAASTNQDRGTPLRNTPAVVNDDQIGANVAPPPRAKMTADGNIIDDLITGLINDP